jgi:pantoate--beta-alanine ligase
MGALHAGHLSLVAASHARCDLTVVSIFVNPTQFGEGEDFESYPRDLDADAELLEASGVDLVFAPGAAVMYPEGSVTRVDPGPLATLWCGASRPGHFVGVATVVTKLLSIVGPDAAFFGEKDFQQVQVIRRVASDLDLPVHIVPCPIIRESDGLAMSSRNRYLTPEDRAHALALSCTLAHVSDLVDAGETNAAFLQNLLVEGIAFEPGVELDYAAVVDAATLMPVTELRGECRALVAARVGSARLIDNVGLRPAG